MEKGFENLGLKDADDFYYLSNASDGYEAHLALFTEILNRHGFSVRQVYHDASSLIHAVKD